MTRRLLPWPIGLAVAAVAIGSVATAAAPVLRLQTLTLQEASDAQAAGVGCSWSLPGERDMRFAAADDHAAVKIDGRVVRLRPAEGAKDMFPFTWDSWAGDGVTVVVRKSRMERVRGSGLLAGPATLVIGRRGWSVVLSGRLECGD